jgi:hypothetical protein
MTAATEPTLTEITIPFPNAPTLHLQFRVGGCRFNLKPGDGEHWVNGTYTDPTDRLKSPIEQAGGIVTLSQAWGVRQMGDLAGLFDKMPRFALDVSRVRPFHLTWEGGAGENHLDLGGLPLRYQSQTARPARCPRRDKTPCRTADSESETEFSGLR